MSPIVGERSYYIDWLRIISVFLLFVFHSAKVFDYTWPFFVQNSPLSPLITGLFIIPFIPWHMPIFFFISGFATSYAIKFKGKKNYIKNRFIRLGIPLLFGILFIVPPQAYYGKIFHYNYEGNFAKFYSEYIIPNPHNFNDYLDFYKGFFTPGQLWFILYLLIISVVVFPIINYLEGEKGKRVIKNIENLSNGRFGFFYPIIPLLIAMLIPILPDRNPIYFTLTFLYGYLFTKIPNMTSLFDKWKRPSLILSILLISPLSIYVSLGLPITQKLIIPAILFMKTIITWFSLVAIIGYSMKFLNFKNAISKYLNKASYPVYILHQTILVFLAFHIVSLNFNILEKFLLIMLSSLTLTMLLYETLRKIKIFRVTLGMKA